MPLCRQRSRCKDRRLFRDSGLGGGQTGDRNSEWTATDVIQAEAVAEFHAVGFAAVLAADSKLDVRSRFPAEISRHFHQTADAALIDRRKRIRIDDVELGGDV